MVRSVTYFVIERLSYITILPDYGCEINTASGATDSSADTYSLSNPWAKLSPSPSGQLLFTHTRHPPSDREYALKAGDFFDFDC